MEYCEGTESPVVYHKWVGLAVLAGAVRSRVWLQYGRLNIHSNLYTMLVGPAGCRKSEAIRLGKRFLSKITGVSVASESITRERLIQDMAGKQESFTFDGETVYESPMMVASSELAVFIGENNGALVKFLCDIYDTTDYGWAYSTKNQGESTIKRPWLSVLGGITPESLAAAIPLTEGSGFTSRFVMAYGNKKAMWVPIPYLTKRARYLEPKLQHDLDLISISVGEMPWEPKAEAFFSAWYPVNVEDTPLINDKRFEGYISRRHIHILKAALLLSIARSLTTLTIPVIKDAIALVKETEKDMVNVYGGMGLSKLSRQQDVVSGLIRRRGEISEPELLCIVACDMDILEYAKIISMLTKTGLVEEKVEGTAKTYVWKGV
ncbi:MAG: DUF3987 domain-containing protein [Candidatus Paceibacterota bacterium]